MCVLKCFPCHFRHYFDKLLTKIICYIWVFSVYIRKKYMPDLELQLFSWQNKKIQVLAVEIALCLLRKNNLKFNNIYSVEAFPPKHWTIFGMWWCFCNISSWLSGQWGVLFLGQEDTVILKNIKMANYVYNLHF